MESTMRKSPDASRHRGPSLLVVSIVYVALFTAGIVIPIAMAGGRHFPSPFDPNAGSYFAEHAGALRLAAFLQLGSAIPLGIFAATATSRLQFLGMKVAGIHIALFGGIAASILLAICACLEWTLAQSSGPYGITEAIHGLAFATGGPAHVATFGILIAGISLVAGLQGFAPRWLMFGGLAIAATAELSTLVFIVPAAAMLLPIARFFGFIWMVCAGVVLPKSRGSAREPIAGRTVPRSLGAERR